jgi:hypothetical protein
VAPGWTAEFIFRDQVSMSGDGWGLVLHGPDSLKIDRFKDFISLCGKRPGEWSDEELMKLLELSDDGRFLKLKVQFDDEWVADLSSGTLFQIKITPPDPWAVDEVAEILME